MKLFKLAQHYDRALTRITYNKVKAEYDSDHAEPIIGSALASHESYSSLHTTVHELKYE